MRVGEPPPEGERKAVGAPMRVGSVRRGEARAGGDVRRWGGPDGVVSVPGGGERPDAGGA